MVEKGGGLGHDHDDSEWADVGCRRARRGARDHPGRKVDSLGCSEGDKTHTRSQAGLHCVWPQFSIGVRRGVWAAETAAAARCLRFHMLASLLAWPGKAGQMIRSGLVAGSADR
jgi:hypothetical protein